MILKRINSQASSKQGAAAKTSKDDAEQEVRSVMCLDGVWTINVKFKEFYTTDILYIYVGKHQCIKECTNNMQLILAYCQSIIFASL